MSWINIVKNIVWNKMEFIRKLLASVKVKEWKKYVMQREADTSYMHIAV